MLEQIVAARRVLPGHAAKVGRELTTGFEGGRIGHASGQAAVAINPTPGILFSPRFRAQAAISERLDCGSTGLRPAQPNPGIFLFV